MNGQRLPSSGSFAICSVAARTCSPSAGRTTAAVDLATHRAARTSGNAASAVSPRCAAANAPTRRSSRSTTVSCWPIFRGARSIGIYPLLPDDRCWLLAIDLDRGSWRADVQALTRTSRSLGLQPAIERSRSGNGAHVWFFFTDPVPAAEARRLGFTILTATMALGAALGVDSYDRLFPSQDVLPSGGFGNLIALPLQRDARNAGNTEFLDERLEPHRDQWSYLASLPKITPDRLAELIADGDEDGALAVRPADGSQRPTMAAAAHPARATERDPTARVDRQPRWRIASTSIVRSFLRHSLTRSGDSRRSPTRCSPSSSGCGCRSRARLA